jgi:hypothetical protein
MFQYAAGLALAKKKNVPVLAYYPDGGRPLLHETFSLTAGCATEADFRQYFGSSGLAGRVNRRVQTMLPPAARRFYENNKLNYDPTLFRLGDNVLLRGYWQSFRYFEDLRSILKAEFTPLHRLSAAAEEMRAQIESHNSIGIHVRRGDYLNAFRVLDADYYSRAIDGISESSLHSSQIFVFTNDAVWCHRHLLPERSKILVSSPLILAHEDLLLLSACRNIITANSTFSWWAAYLADAPASIIAPQGWICGDSEEFKQEDIYPETWDIVS